LKLLDNINSSVHSNDPSHTWLCGCM